MTNRQLFILGAVLVCTRLAAAQGTFILNFNTIPADWGWGWGSDYLTSAAGYAFNTTSSSSNVASFFIDGPEHHLRLELGVPQGEALQVQLYSDAPAFPFRSPTQPGFTFAGDGWFQSSSISSFQILQIERDANGGIQAFAVDFLQRTAGFPGIPYTEGQLRFNSAIPVPEPGTHLLAFIGGVLIALFHGRCSRKRIVNVRRL